MLVPMRRRKLSEVAVERIRGLIDSGELRPGDRLPTERELSLWLQVSRNSIREALRALEALGLIQVSPGRGTFVRAAPGERRGGDEAVALPSLQGALEEVLEVRSIVETRTCVLAAHRSTPEDVREMQATIDEMREALAVGDIARAVLLDMAFHHALAGATRNGLLVRLEAALAHQLMDCRRISLAADGLPVRPADRHQLILNAVKARDGDWAASLMLDGLKALESELRGRRPGAREDWSDRSPAGDGARAARPGREEPPGEKGG